MLYELDKSIKYYYHDKKPILNKSKTNNDNKYDIFQTDINKNVIEIFKDKSLEEIQSFISDTRYNYHNLAVNIHGDINVGCMMRSSHQCGCKKFIIFGKKKFDKRSSVGAQNYIDCQFLIKDVKLILDEEDYILDENILFDFIISNKYLPIFVELDDQSIKVTKNSITNIILESIKLNLIPLFIYGNETFGISKNILDLRNKLKNHYTLELKQNGVMPSYNVSNALSIISYYVMEVYNEL